jgi:O-antigen biosynthesis protein
MEWLLNTNHIKDQLIQNLLSTYRDEMITELRWAQAAQNDTKDILIVVHNQYEFVKKCIESIQKNTTNYQLYLWDNDSDEETKAYLRSVENAVLVDNSTNIGFGEPNNCLAAMGQGKYIILLNSDTEVFPMWSESLLGYLQHNPRCSQVGYLGGRLDEEGKGGRADWGSKIDYIMGFCSCISRQTYRKYGLFDPAYEFAYCEDADLSLRLQAAGEEIYALHLMLVHHYQNRTIKAVVKEGKDVTATFQRNHAILKEKWSTYLSVSRADLRL